MIINRRKVRILMAEHDIASQSGLAERIGVTRGAVSNWMNGGNISGDNALILANILQCSLDDIVECYSDHPEAVALVAA